MIDRQRSGLANTFVLTGGGFRGASSHLYSSAVAEFHVGKDPFTVADWKKTAIAAGLNLGHHQPVGAD